MHYPLEWDLPIIPDKLLVIQTDAVLKDMGKGCIYLAVISAPLSNNFVKNNDKIAEIQVTVQTFKLFTYVTEIIQKQLHNYINLRYCRFVIVNILPKYDCTEILKHVALLHKNGPICDDTGPLIGLYS
jgi:hypothetical protein